jgi:hypothetical protein
MTENPMTWWVVKRFVFLEKSGNEFSLRDLSVNPTFLEEKSPLMRGKYAS